MPVKSCRSKQIALLFVLATAGSFLQGCSFGTEAEHCNGDACACDLTFHSFWARIRISGVPIEHASRIFHIPNVARDVPNASAAACCDAIFEQIDYDEGRSSATPDKRMDSFAKSCATSPNKEVASAATKQNVYDVEPKVVLRRLTGSHRATPNHKRALHAQAASEPIDSGEVGQDCEVSTNNFTLSSTSITSGSTTLKIKWVDPNSRPTTCCDALKPLLEQLYFYGVDEAHLPSNITRNFCNSCKMSNNQGVALAAYKCFGAGDTTGVSV